jgi:hypothetical protein
MILMNHELAGGKRRPDEQYVMSRAWRFDMKALSKLFVLLAALALASCGGGGGGSQGAFTPTPSDTITISAASTSIPVGSFTTLTVTVKKADGSVENDGTLINASLSPSTIGTVSGSGAAGTTASNTLSGGSTSFNFTSSNQTGTATITISVPAGTNGATTTATATVGIAVTAGNNQDPRLALSATTTTLPINPYTYGQQQADPFPGNFPGSPYIAEVTLTWRHSNGQLVTGTSTVNVSVAPTTIIAFSTLNTSGGDEFHTLLGSGPVDVTGGVGTIFIHSSPTPGTAVLIVTATDPDNAQTISSQLAFTVAGAASNLPSSITAASAGAVYISGSGGAQSTIVSATVTDGNNALVPDPSGYDNVQFQIVGPANSDARLSGLDAAGNSVSGTTVNTVTHNGIASVTLQAGSQQGPVQIRATADRGDNNVDNGIQDGVSATTTVVISDGKLFNLTLTQPGPNAGSLLINGVSADASSTAIPADVNGTYSLTISAQGQDRQGNPVLPGTLIHFGEIDGPLNGFTGTNRGLFSITGGDGNPQEGGTLFTAPGGAFTTAGGGAGPGDSVLVFGKEVTGNRDLENARTVRTINSATSLNTTIAFNTNDDTGSSVDYGPVLPYIIGRALDGNITASASTNDVGVATVHLTYPVSKLGKLAAVWAQGNGNVTGNATKTVDDIALVRFAGVAAVGDLAAAVTASPNPIYGNTTQYVTACIADALGSPLQGIQFSFQYSGTGTAKVDGTTGAGLLASLTDESGCALATVVTSGVSPSTDTGGGGELMFCVGDLCATVDVVVNIASLQVSPASVSVGAASKNVSITITALDTLGNKTPGVAITGTCSASGGAGATIQPSTFSGTTGANGSVVDTVTASNFVLSGDPPQVGAGQCTFSATGVASATVNFNGFATCNDFSPSTCN